MFDRTSRRSLLAAAVVLILPLAACGDDEVDDHEELPEFMDLTIGATTLRVDNSGVVVSGGPATLTLGTSVSVTARFIADDGDVLDLDAEFELRGTSTAASVITFVSTGPLSGTLTPVAVGQAAVAFELFHTVENHSDWGPHDVAFTIVAP